MGMSNIFITKILRLKTMNRQPQVNIVRPQDPVMSREILEDQMETFLLNKSQSTIKNYTRYIKFFIDFMEKKYFTFSKGNILAYQHEICMTNKYTPSTQTQNLRCIKSFLNFISNEFKIHTIGIELKPPQQVDKPRKGIGKERMMKILKAAQELSNDHYIMILIMILCGLRRKEVIQIKKKDFVKMDKDSYTLKIYGKGRHGGKIGYVKFKAPAELIKKMNSIQNDDYFFVSRKTNGHISLETCNRWISKIGQIAGINNLAPHDLRRYAITSVYKRTKDIELVRRFSRHENINHTQRYLKIDDYVNEFENNMFTIDDKED